MGRRIPIRRANEQNGGADRGAAAGVDGGVRGVAGGTGDRIRAQYAEHQPVRLAYSSLRKLMFGFRNRGRSPFGRLSVVAICRLEFIRIIACSIHS